MAQAETAAHFYFFLILKCKNLELLMWKDTNDKTVCNKIPICAYIKEAEQQCLCFFLRSK